MGGAFVTTHAYTVGASAREAFVRGVYDRGDHHHGLELTSYTRQIRAINFDGVLDVASDCLSMRYAITHALKLYPDDK